MDLSAFVLIQPVIFKFHSFILHKQRYSIQLTPRHTHMGQHLFHADKVAVPVIDYSNGEKDDRHALSYQAEPCFFVTGLRMGVCVYA
jgi:hypothetical protein